MKSIEALFTLFVVLGFSLMVRSIPERPLDDTLYRYQLVNDVWRVWQLRGDLAGFDRDAMHADAQRMGALTGWCIYLEEEDVASCREGNVIAAARKTARVKGALKNVTVVVAN